MKLVIRGPIVLLVLFSTLVLATVAAFNVLLHGTLSAVCGSVSVLLSVLNRGTQEALAYWGRG